MSTSRAFDLSNSEHDAVAVTAQLIDTVGGLCAALVTLLKPDGEEPTLIGLVPVTHDPVEATLEHDTVVHRLSVEVPEGLTIRGLLCLERDDDCGLGHVDSLHTGTVPVSACHGLAPWCLLVRRLV